MGHGVCGQGVFAKWGGVGGWAWGEWMRGLRAQRCSGRGVTCPPPAAPAAEGDQRDEQQRAPRGPPQLPRQLCKHSRMGHRLIATGSGGWGAVGGRGGAHTCPVRSISSCSKGKAQSGPRRPHPRRRPPLTPGCAAIRQPASPGTAPGVPQTPRSAAGGSGGGAAERGAAHPLAPPGVPAPTWSAVPLPAAVAR